MIELMIQYLKGARNRSLGLIQYLFFFFYMLLCLSAKDAVLIFSREQSPRISIGFTLKISIFYLVWDEWPYVGYERKQKPFIQKV